ncbi:MAG: adenylate/guanylate cyclase domain-containing protein [Sediminispirochaetaceae bacterium]
MSRNRKISINRKVNSIILASLFAGLGGVVFFFAVTLNTTIQKSTEERLDEQSDILFTAIENFMLPGEAPLAVQYFTEVRRRSPLTSIFLFRTDGVQAFTDTDTIAAVNGRLNANTFEEQDRGGIIPLTRADPDFSAAVGIPPMTGLFQSRSPEGKVFFHIYKPLINKPKCTSCHGADHTIRGVLEIQTDISASVQQRENAVLASGIIFIGVLFLLSLLLTRFMNRTVITPVQRIGEVCRAVTGGDFSPRVAIKNRDEIGELGETVNTMVEGLHERYELSKFVSNSTLKSLRKKNEGQQLTLTLFFSDIRGFTSYSEKHTPAEVVERLNVILNMQSQIISAREGDIDKFVGDEVIAVFIGKKGVEQACRSALEIQQVLKSGPEEFDGLHVGIGIHTGSVIMGMIGSKERADFTVIGDSVNLASRLCNSAGPDEVLISIRSQKQVPGIFDLEGPFKLRVKGKHNYVGVYRLKAVREGEGI